MPIAASEKAALPKTDIRAVHQALDAEHRTWAREDDSPQGSVKARLEQAWPDSLADGQLIKDDEGRDQLKAMPEAKRSSMFPDPWRTNPVGRFWDRLRGRDVTPRYLSRLTQEERESEQKWRTVGTIRRYILLLLTLSVLLLSLDGFDLVTTFTSVATCLNNVGPGLEMVGPMGSFADFSAPAKLLLAFDMLAGRLELYPMLALFAPRLWRKRINAMHEARAK